ncbi:MAG: tetratricopeptide repeat protein [Chlorobiaceae bacterium]|nr:tetratricopeptide repeat protein [Chlorobiaceae bacterium]
MKRLAILFLLAIAGMTAFVNLCSAESANTYFNQGLASHKTGDLKEAVRLYSRAIDTDNRFVMAYQMRGAAWQKLKQYQKAIADYSMVIELGEPYFQSVGYFNRGIVKNMSGNYGDAAADFTFAINIDRKMAAAYFHRGIARLKSGDQTGQLDDFMQAARLGDLDAERWLDKTNPDWKQNIK